MNLFAGESRSEDFERLSTKIHHFPKNKDSSSAIILLEKEIILNHNGSDRIVPIVKTVSHSEHEHYSSYNSKFDFESLKKVKIHFYRNENGSGRNVFKNGIDVLHNPLNSLFISFGLTFSTTYAVIENGMTTGLNSAIIAASGVIACLGCTYGIFKRENRRNDFIENIFKISEKDFLESVNNRVFNEIYNTQLNDYEKLKLFYQFVRFFYESLNVDHIDSSIEKKSHKKFINSKDIETDVAWIRKEYLQEASRKFKKTYTKEESENIYNRQGIVPGYVFKQILGTYEPLRNPLDEDSRKLLKGKRNFENSINFEKVFERI